MRCFVLVALEVNATNTIFTALGVAVYSDLSNSIIYVAWAEVTQIICYTQNAF